MKIRHFRRSIQTATLLLAASGLVAAQISDAQLRADIESEYPAIVSAGNWDRVRILREYSYKHTAYATSVATNAYAAGDQTVQSVVNGGTLLGDGYEFFNQAGGGQVCGGISLMLMKLFQLYGYTSSTLQIGWSSQHPTPSGSNFGHVQTYATISHGSKTYRVVNDAITNFTYTTTTGAPIDYHDMVWLLAQNKSNRISTTGAIDGTGHSPRALTVGFESDEPDAGVGLASASVDPMDYSFTQLTDRWYYSSPRTVARMEALGAQSGSWHDQLATEGRPRETIYLHTFPYDPLGTAGPVVARSKTILRDFRVISFNFREGFGGISANPGINQVSAAFNAQFRITNDSCTNGCGVGLYPTPSVAAPESYLYFQPRAGSVAGEISFPVAATAVDLDVMYFNGGNVTMTAFNASGGVVGSSQATDVAGNNHLGVSATQAQTITKVSLTGSNGNAAINIKNLQIRTLGSTTRFSYHEGFSTGGNPGINNVAAGLNAQFTLANDSCTNGCGVGLYPVPTATAPNSFLYFQPRNGSVLGQITFATPVSAVAVDVTYFNGGTVTMTAYDALGVQLDSASATDQAGQNRLSVSGNPGNTKPIKYVRLSGAAGGAAINIKNLRQFSWNP